MTQSELRLAAGLLIAVLAGLCDRAVAEGLSAASMGVVFNSRDPVSARVAGYYADRRGIPQPNLVGLEVPDRPRLTRGEFAQLRAELTRKLPTRVQSLLLVWARPYAVDCMSVTTAFAADYSRDFCTQDCGRTRPNPLFDSDGWLPADTVGWLPAMMLPTDDEARARRLIDRGVTADGTEPPGTVYLVSTSDRARNVRAAGYAAANAALGLEVRMRIVETPLERPLDDIITYFTGAARVSELSLLGFRPGAVADHLTSFGGVLDGRDQMSVLAWLDQGATGSYGTVSEPCNLLGKFPSPAVFLDHYLRGETLLEAYWKSVRMPGEGLFVGEPLARPYPRTPIDYGGTRRDH